MSRKNWLLGAGAIAVIGIPLGIALRQDLKGERAAPPAPGPVAATPVAPEEKTDAAPRATKRMDAAFFRDVLGTTQARPALVGPLFRVRWGVTRQELERMAPELFTWNHPDVTIVPLLDKERRVAAIEIEFPDDGTARATFLSAWGPQDEDGPGWHSADVRVAFEAPEPGLARVVVSPGDR
jgi:hypothetical protein